MTTAHRPTWTPAIGGEEQGGSRMFVASRQISAKNLPGHTKLKFRQDGQSSAKELKERDLLAELEEKERLSLLKKRKADNFSEEQVQDLKLLEGGPVKTARPLVPKNIDADDDDGDDDDDDDDSDDDEDDEDDEAALLAELERIKKERAEEAAAKAREEEAAAQAEQADEMLRRNPLLLQEADMTIKRRWDDDVIFKNQARGEPKKQARFVNDTIRNDFHKRFLHRYIK